MLEKYSYVFVIGAGAAHPYNFPLGLELYSDISKNYAKYVENYFTSDRNFGHLDTDRKIRSAKNFCEELSLTSGVSIDKYLNVNKTFREDGVQAIAAEICSCEAKSLLPMGTNAIEGDWYSYLYKKLIEGLNTSESLLKIGQNKVSFITFNYDRSLEHFLFENLYGLLKNAGVTPYLISEAIKSIEFIHVYGQTGHLPWQVGIYSDEQCAGGKETLVEYGAAGSPPMAVARRIFKMINIMYDERKGSEEIENAKKLIRNADRVMFLGFGYDDQNLELLGMSQVLEGKRVYGTAHKATQNEIIHIENKLNLKAAQTESKIYDFDCLMLLREHLV